jgi:hypothetical protein
MVQPLTSATVGVFDERHSQSHAIGQDFRVVAPERFERLVD